MDENSCSDDSESTSRQEVFIKLEENENSLISFLNERDNDPFTIHPVTGIATDRMHNEVNNGSRNDESPSTLFSEYFIYHPKTNKSECTICNSILVGKAQNRRRHIALIHPELALSLGVKSSKKRKSQDESGDDSDLDWHVGPGTVKQIDQDALNYNDGSDDDESSNEGKDSKNANAYRQFFKYDKSKGCCECKLCKTVLSGYILPNLKRHFITIHKDHAFKLGVEVKKRIKPNKNKRSKLKMETKLESKKPSAKRISRNTRSLAESEDESDDNKDEDTVSENFDWKNYFIYNEEGNYNDCTLCDQKISGTCESNKKRHFVKVHDELAKNMGVRVLKRHERIERQREIKAAQNEPSLSELVNGGVNLSAYTQSLTATDEPSTSKSASVEQKMFKSPENSRSECIKSLVCLVAVELFPLNLVDCDSFRRLTSIHSFISDVDVTAANAVKYIAQTAEVIRKTIKYEVKSRMISLKLEVGVHFDKKILIVNGQFHSQDFKKTNFRTFGIIDISKSENCEEKLFILLKAFRILPESVSTFTINEKIIERREIIAATVENQTTSNDAEDSSDDENSLSYHEPFKTIKDENCSSIDKLLESKLFTENVSNIMHCALNKAFEALNVSESISKVHEILKSLKSIKQTSIRVPHIKADLKTNWHSAYIVFERLIAFRSKLSAIYKRHRREDIVFSKEDWDFIHQFTDIFEPAYDAFSQLENENILTSDFYKIWLECLSKLGELIEKNEYAEVIIKELEANTQSLIKNDAFCSALYMDPRFNFSGSKLIPEDAQKSVQQNLLRIVQQIVKQKSFSSKNKDVQEVCRSGAEKLFDEKFVTSSREPKDSDKVLMELIVNIRNQERKNFNTNPLDYYKQFIADEPLLFELAVTVFATPVSQASTKRASKAFSIVLSPDSKKLKQKIREDISLISMNKDFLHLIDFSKMKS